jgi:hypothetical protein
MTRRSHRALWLSLHVVTLVALFLSYMWADASYEEPNVGAGMFLLLIAGARLPWSFMALPQQGAAFAMLLASSAVANLALHEMLWRLAARRSSRATNQ